MWELMLTTSHAIESVVTIKWVWTIIGLLVWLATIWLGVSTEPEYRRTEAAILGSLGGAFLGFIFPFILIFLPFLLPILLVVAILGCLGAVIANFTRLGQ